MTVTSHRDNGPAARLSAVVTTAPYLVLAAIGAPVLAGLATMLLPASRKLPRLVLATAGPTASVVLVAAHLGRSGVSTADTPTGSISWVPSLNLDISFLVDGLGAFFALLIAGMGVVVVLYARAYFGHDAASLARFFPTLGFFTSAMLGVVLADHLLLTVLFWEMTSISSFLLIGWDRDDTDAGKRAMQAFFTTGLGGLALLGGVLLFGGHTGIWRWSGLIAEAATLSHDGTVVAAFVLMFVGAATKSAQWPLHDWLPGAMKAPTPVSAYLHSATMVKAGVFLLGRMLPAFGALAPWLPLLVSIGAVTMLLGAVLALHQDDLKKMFAYTTVSHLGLLVAMYGMGGASTADGIRTIDWDLTQIASHALYKAPLFLAVGALAHLAGARRLSQLFGLWHRPGAGTRAAALVLLLSGYALASGPGTVSFVAKELFFAATTRASDLHPLLAVVGVMAIVAAACNVAIFVRLVTTVMGHRSGVGNDSDAPVVSLIQPDRWASMLWAPAAALIALQYLGGLVPSLWNRTFRGIEVNVHDEAFATGLPLAWEPFLHPGVPLLMTAIAITAGVLLGFSGWMRREIVDVHARIWPATYRGIMQGGHRLFQGAGCQIFKCRRLHGLEALERGPTLAVKGFHALLEIFRRAQAAIGIALDLDPRFHGGILRRVQDTLDGALGQGREFPQLVHECIHGLLQFIVRHAVEDKTPFLGLGAGNPAGAEGHVLGPLDANHMEESDGAARTGDLADALFRQGKLRRLGTDAEITSQGQFEPDAEAVAADLRHHRFVASARRPDVVGQLGNMLRRGGQETGDIAARREMFALRAQDDNADPIIRVQFLEHHAQLVALAHLDHIQGRSVENDIGPLPIRIDLDPEAIKVFQ